MYYTYDSDYPFLWAFLIFEGKKDRLKASELEKSVTIMLD